MSKTLPDNIAQALAAMEITSTVINQFNLMVLRTSIVQVSKVICESMAHAITREKLSPTPAGEKVFKMLSGGNRHLELFIDIFAATEYCAWRALTIKEEEATNEAAVLIQKIISDYSHGDISMKQIPIQAIFRSFDDMFDRIDSKKV